MIDLSILNSELENICKRHKCAAAVWGSYIREEVTPNSDIDIIVFSYNNDTNLKGEFIKELQNCFPDEPHWDISKASLPLKEFVSLNGTNYHSVFFSSKIVGEAEAVAAFIKERNFIRSDSDHYIREFFNLFTSYWGLAHVITPNDVRYSKFGINGTNKWARLFQAAQIRWQNLIDQKSLDILSFLCERYNLDFRSFYKNYRYDFSIRTDVEKNNSSWVAEDVVSSAWKQLFECFAIDCITWVQQTGGINPDSYFAFLKRFGIENIPEIPKYGKYNITAETLIGAFIADTDQEIRRLYKENIDDWWVLTNLCVNTNTSEKLLDEIVFPKFHVDNTLWKSIRLYVAKNRNTSVRTLNNLLATRGLREQDYASALANLNYKLKNI